VLVVIGCIWGYLLLQRKRIADLFGFFVTFALTTGFFALDIYLFQPRYLPFLRHLLYPHRTW
jgi:hypothetical protein